MKKSLFALLFALLPLLANAQETSQAGAHPLRFAWFSQEEVLRAMPEYAAAERYLDSLRAEYNHEAKRSADDFSIKYEEFLDQQRTLATSIRNKRQAELQDMMLRNIAFKTEGEQLLERETKRVMAQVKRRLHTVVAEIARKRGYAFVLNSDNDNLPYADRGQGDDITQALKEKLTAEK